MPDRGHREHRTSDEGALVNHRTIMRTSGVIATAAVAGALALAVGTPATAASGINSTALRAAITQDGLMGHLEALQAVADENGGNRAAGSSGYEASAAYVEDTLLAAGYTPVRQEFTYEQFILNDSAFSADGVTYGDPTDYSPMSYSGSGDITATLQAVDVNLAGTRASTSGCEDSDFDSFIAGNIALVQRGSCTFRVKVDNAAANGASAIVVFNQGNDVPGDDRFGVVFGTLDPPLAAIPAIGTSFAIGEALVGAGAVQARVMVDATTETTDTFNVIADTPTGRDDRTVVIGAHLDSVHEGPGINDNGTGTATVLETAVQMAELGIEPRNTVRFAFWGGEEDGLIGSEYYVSQLSKAQIKQHAVNLNFDMLGSVNAVRFVYDGDGDAFGTTGPNGSDIIEGVFDDYFASQGLATEPTEFDGRSDYFAFINNGIPAGGLFSGAEGLMTPQEAEDFDGTAGAPYDPCYHQACDTIDNVDGETLEELADAAAHATLTFAQTTSAVNGTAKGKAVGQFDPTFKGHLALR